MYFGANCSVIQEYKILVMVEKKLIGKKTEKRVNKINKGRKMRIP